jgi:hypothetical protein
MPNLTPSLAFGNIAGSDPGPSVDRALRALRHMTQLATGHTSFERKEAVLKAALWHPEGGLTSVGRDRKFRVQNAEPQKVNKRKRAGASHKQRLKLVADMISDIADADSRANAERVLAKLESDREVIRAMADLLAVVAVPCG